MNNNNNNINLNDDELKIINDISTSNLNNTYDDNDNDVKYKIIYVHQQPINKFKF